MIQQFAYGKSGFTLEIPDSRITASLAPPSGFGAVNGEDEAARALREPTGAPRLAEYALAGKKIVIITSDVTRPMPTATVIRPLLDELHLAGARDEDITVVIALGSHRPQTEDERRHILGDPVYGKLRCVDAAGDDYVLMGVTSRGTPVDIFGEVARADFRICLGNIEYHYFAGYSGGVKAIMPGVSTREAIRRNHSRMTEPGATAGVLDGNPVREDIEEAGRICAADYILNVVLDPKKQILRAFAGDPVKAHREGCAFLDGVWGIPIPDRADIVIVSPGGYPKDMNMYQAQKALDNAGKAVKDGGTVIWIAECTEGFGEPTFEKWMLGHDNCEAMTEHIRREFVLGGHKAAAIAMLLRRASVILVSAFGQDTVRRMFMEPISDPTAAFDLATARHGADSSVILMPSGGSTLPVIRP